MPNKCINCWHCKCCLKITTNHKGEVRDMPIEFSNCYCELEYWYNEISLLTLRHLSPRHDIMKVGRCCKDYDDKEEE